MASLALAQTNSASAATSGSPAKSSSTASSAALDWPAPLASFDSSARRPSWQPGFSLNPSPNTVNSSENSRLQTSKLHPSASGITFQRSFPAPSQHQHQQQLGPAIVLGPTPITFRSPFAARPVVSSAAEEEELSPFCWPASPTYPSGASTPSTVLSSPGVSTPSGSISSSCQQIPPFDAAFKKRIDSISNSIEQQQQRGSLRYSRSSASPRDYTVFPKSPRNAVGSMTSLAGLPPLDMSVRGSPPSEPASPMSGVSLRRRSVDVGMLVNARGHQQSGRTAQPDAPAAAFVPPEQLRAQRAQRSSKIQTKESLFAQHLTSILSHSLSLCTAGGTPMSQEDGACTYDPATTSSDSATAASSSFESSPRSSISSQDGRSLSSSDAVASSSSSLQQQQPGTPLRGRQRLPSLPSVSLKRRLQLVQFAAEWSFDANELDQDELCECACMIFECVLIMEGLDKAVTMKRIRPLLLSLRSAYHSRNAYHNFAHAVDVLQAIYSFLVSLGLAPPLSVLTDASFTNTWKREPSLSEQGALGDLLRPMDVLALLIAAIGHDVGHPGLSNAYMVNARTAVAQVYNDKSVLENFHSVTLARMLKLHGFGFLLEGESGTTEFRQVLLASVLATDMSRHFPFVGKLTELGARLRNNGYRSVSVDDDRLLLCSGLMKCADISNPTRPHNVARQWSTALLEEWAVQAQIEAKFKLPISVVILNPEERLAQAKSQVGFINLFTQPLFDSLAQVDPKFQIYAEKCKDGKAVWESEVLAGEESCSRGGSLATTPSVEAGPALGQGKAGRSPSATPTLGSSFAFTSVVEHSASPSLSLPVSKGFSSRLPPHRAPRSLKQIDATRANALSTGASAGISNTAPSSPSSSSSPSRGVPFSARSTGSNASSTYTSSPAARPSSLFDRSSSYCSSTGTPSSSLLSAKFAGVSLYSNNDECAFLDLGDEDCTGNCSFVTASCTECANKAVSRGSTQSGPGAAAAEEQVTYFGSPVDSGIWPPNPFRPRPNEDAKKLGL